MIVFYIKIMYTFWLLPLSWYFHASLLAHKLYPKNIKKCGRSGQSGWLGRSSRPQIMQHIRNLYHLTPLSTIGTIWRPDYDVLVMTCGNFWYVLSDIKMLLDSPVLPGEGVLHPCSNDDMLQPIGRTCLEKSREQKEHCILLSIHILWCSVLLGIMPK